MFDKLNVPICRACPGCGTTAAKKIGSSKLLSASGDRLCLKCGTRYTPPTPRWISWTFLVSGLGLAGPTIPVVVVLVMGKLDGGVELVSHGESWVDTPSSWAVLSCAVVSAGCGLFCLVQGWRMLREKPVEPPKPTARSAGSISGSV